MNVRCPSCETLYRVDPAKVPDEGVRASCATCGSVFPVTHQREDPAPLIRPRWRLRRLQPNRSPNPRKNQRQSCRT
jgi:predicted Zn finger-like uncharacterized protein